MEVYNGDLYVGTDNREFLAELWRFDGTTWEQVTVFDSTAAISVLSEMDGLLYVGTWDLPPGFELWRYDGVNFEQLVEDSDHIDSDLGIMAMHRFQGKMYLGTSNFAHGAMIYSYDPATDVLEPAVIRGFGHPHTAYFWRLEVHKERLVTGTFNSGFLDGGKLLDRPFQLWSTDDGKDWRLDVPNGFCNVENYGVRALLSTGDRLYLGTANNYFTGHGTEVWMREDLD
jgi:hypothetical protein